MHILNSPDDRLLARFGGSADLTVEVSPSKPERSC